MRNGFPSDWQTVPLEDCMSAIIDYRGKSPRKTTLGIPLITAKIVKDGRIESPEEFIADEDFNDWMRRGLPEAGDVLMTTEAPLGEIAQLDSRKVALAQRLITLRGKPGLLDNTYLKFLMQSQFVQEQLKARSTGTTVLGIRQSELRKVLLLVPPIAEQRAIARVLGTLDDKIELNRRMNETLEAMAQALFKAWFVDSIMGGLPKGWRRCSIRELANNIQYGLTQSASTEPIGPRFLRITDIQGGHVDWSRVPFCKISTDDLVRYRLKKGDVLVARTGASTGENVYLAAVPDAVFASYLVRFQFSDPAIARFVGMFMRTSEYFDYVAGCIGGSAQPNASAQVLAAAKLVIPNSELVQRYAQTVGPMDKRIFVNTQESETLTKLRDALLPRLLSGALRLETKT